MITGQRLLGASLPPTLGVKSAEAVGEVRRLAAEAARALGFGPDQESRVSIAATEMASNLMRYAQSGRVFVRLVESGDHCGVELVAVDRGPGMADAEVRLADGYSTGGGLGGGLGAVSRLSDSFDLFSVAGVGTVVMARLWGGRPPPASVFLCGAVAEPIAGEAISGDAWAAAEGPGGRAIAVLADGLGHGADAALASGAAIDAFRRYCREPAESVVGRIHAALQGTRGAAVAVAEIDRDVGRLRFCGVGNIAARVLQAGGSANLVSSYGIVGFQVRRFKTFEVPWGPEALLVMHSDGCSASWDFSGSPGLACHHPLLAAATVLRAGERGSDDVTVFALRERAGCAPMG